jgi:beta-lactamase class D
MNGPKPRPSRTVLGLVVLGMTVAGCGTPPRPTTDGSSRTNSEAKCFLLHEMGVGEVRRSPGKACGTRVTPASTFKIPHALAALDSGVLSGPESSFKYDGGPVPFPAWRRDHTLASAMRYSVVWYFQKVAAMLGQEREAAYLRKLGYGNADSSSGLTSFWLEGSLLISPDEQERFLVQLYGDALPVSKEA